MNLISRASHFAIILFCCVNLPKAQGLIFSGDTALLISCENRPPDTDYHKIYNTTDQDVLLRWKRTRYQIPAGTDFLMIFNGIQYFPFVSSGNQYLDANDSTEIIFSFWHDTLVPGDSVIIQIMVYDDADSINTVHFQTVIQHCPLQTNIVQPGSERLLQVFPNPILNEWTIRIPDDLEAASLILYTTTGDIARHVPVTNKDIHLSRDGLPAGMYFLSLQQNGHPVAIMKIVVID